MANNGGSFVPRTEVTKPLGWWTCFLTKEPLEGISRTLTFRYIPFHMSSALTCLTCPCPWGVTRGSFCVVLWNARMSGSMLAVVVVVVGGGREIGGRGGVLGGLAGGRSVLHGRSGILLRLPRWWWWWWWWWTSKPLPRRWCCQRHRSFHQMPFPPQTQDAPTPAGVLPWFDPSLYKSCP